MCQFGDSSKIIKEHNISENEALIGWRNCHVINPLNDREKHLKALNNQYNYPKNSLAIGDPTVENSEGIYSYNNHYNNHYYYNNYDDYYNYNNYYNNNYHYYNNYYNYNNHYYYNNYDDYYCIQLQIKHWGRIFEYSEGYRSEFAYPTQLVILDKNSRWFSDEKTIEFANHFNSLIEQLAKEYGCDVIEYSNRK